MKLSPTFWYHFSKTRPNSPKPEDTCFECGHPFKSHRILWNNNCPVKDSFSINQFFKLPSFILK